MKLPKVKIKRPSMSRWSTFVMICLLISILATSLSLVNANDDFITRNDTFENIHRNLDTHDKDKPAGNKNAGDSPADPSAKPVPPTPKPTAPKVTKPVVPPKGDKNQIVLPKKYTIDPLDILKGAGDFRFKTNEDLLKKW
jgi:hypothetical protein